MMLKSKIMRKLTASLHSGSSSPLSVGIKQHYQFASRKCLLSITQKLAKLDSQTADQLTRNFLVGYQKKESLEDVLSLGNIASNINSSYFKDQSPRKIKKSSRKNEQWRKTGWMEAFEKEVLTNGYQINDQEILTKQAQGSTEFIKAVSFLYETLSNCKIGFLKGDIHSELYYKLHKKLEKMQESQLLEEFSEEEAKSILEQVTEQRYFRFPRFGIQNGSLEDRNNLYQRQLFLEIVSAEQAQEKYDEILHSLVKIGRVHLSDNLRKYIVEWFLPLCEAIRDEQLKCRDPVYSSEPNRKIYAAHFMKLSPQRLASVCLSELMKSITTILYKDMSMMDCLGLEQDDKKYEFEQYDSIKYKKLCMALAQWVSIQSSYEHEQRLFRRAMREYDNLFDINNEVIKEELEHLTEKIQKKEKVQHGHESHGQINSEIEQDGDMSEADKQFKMKKKKIQEKVQQIKDKYGINYVRPSDRKVYLVEIAKKLMRFPERVKGEKDLISSEAQFQMGVLLIYLMKEIIKIKNKSGYRVSLLTIEHKLIRSEKEVYSEKLIKVHEHFLNTILPELEKEGDLFMHLDRAVPTIVEPLPWLEYEIGGYYLQPSVVMRFSDCKVQERLVRYSDMSRVYDVLNFLGRTPWKINKKVLEIIEAIWTEGGEVGEVPKRYSEPISTYISKLNKEKNPYKQKYLQKMIQTLRDQHSMRADFGLKMNLARSFSKMDRFFFPHNLDFRGRVYPVPPHLNHIGNDLSRGLLLFAEGKRLGERGLTWLKIHCANLMGKDKATVPQKLAFLEENIQLIKNMAEKPLEYREWLKYEDCWQAIGAIIELNDALNHPVPQDYVSCLHVHQDGSCNGLQHYAALGRDMEGAYQVNLGPTERPGDVYTHVAKMVIKLLEEDIANPESENHVLAKKLHGNIKRKTIKQTVMTSVYGVTFIGARDQILRQIRDQNKEGNFLANDDECFSAGIYLAKCTLNSISTLFDKAHLIKKWLISCAKIVTEEGNPMGWITPMGLPVVQPYRKESRLDSVNTIIQELRLPSKSENLPVNKTKQMSAFPPNFVHSLDSTHMMFTAERCMKLGLSFAAVHDSYWTHAATVDDMNVLLREEFIRLHSQPLLENLKSSLQRRYPQIKFPQIPTRGEFDLQKIKESVYFFS